MFTEIFNKKLLFVSGKGGTGKSVVSALLALAAARSGKRVLLAESHAFDKLSPLFGKAPIGHHEVPVAENLSCINLDPKRCFAEYVILHLGMEALYERVFRNHLVTSLLDAIPGLDETMLLGRLFYACELSHSTKYDLVIFDSPASGHFVTLLSTLDAIIKTGLAGPLVKEVRRVKEYHSDRTKCGVVLVSLPEELVMNETLDFLPRFEKSLSIGLATVILNRTFKVENGNYPPAIREYVERKDQQTVTARKELLSFLTERRLCKTAYGFPELEMVPEPLTQEKLASLLPSIERYEIATDPS